MTNGQSDERIVDDIDFSWFFGGGCVLGLSWVDAGVRRAVM